MRQPTFLPVCIVLLCITCWSHASTPANLFSTQITPTDAPTVAPTISKVHAVFVFDTNGHGIGEFVKRDRWNVLRTFHGGFRDAGQEHRLVWKCLDGQNAHPQAVVQAINNLRPASDDAILVYYAGHGAVDAARGHYLNMRAGRLHRSTIQATMRKHQVRLSVLITESCAVVEPAARMRTAFKPGGPPTGNWQTLSKLLFEQKGKVDFNTSAPNQVAGAGSQTGAFFTSCLADVLCRPPMGNLTWRSAVAQAEQRLSRYVPRQRQRVYAYAMGEDSTPAGRPSGEVVRGSMQRLPHTQPINRQPPAARHRQLPPQTAWHPAPHQGYPMPVAFYP